MKEERMAILRMLEKGIITATEAERLLLALQERAGKIPPNREDVSTNINSALSKAGEILESFVQTVGEKAEDAAKEMEPIIKKVKETVSEKAEDVKTYAEKVKREILEEKERSKRTEQKKEGEPEEQNDETCSQDLSASQKDQENPKHGFCCEKKTPEGDQAEMEEEQTEENKK